MPIDETTENEVSNYNQINVPLEDSSTFFLNFLVFSNGTATLGEMDTVTQSLVDLLQGWAYRRLDQNVTGTKSNMTTWVVRPTNPLPPADPPEDPPLLSARRLI